MLNSSHLQKIVQCESVMARLDPEEDFELWFWAAMVGGTNAVNMALHHAKVTTEETAFPSQPGVYFVPVGDGYDQVVDRRGDILHVGRPPIEGDIPPDVQVMMTSMEVIEQYRDPCTRGDMPVTADVISSCLAAYDTCMKQLRLVLKEQ